MNNTTKPSKPLRGKAYGSIGHLPQSRLGPGDWHVHEGQARICLEKPRRADRVIVTEKLDGACMSVARISGALVPLSRAGYRSSEALYDHLRLFDAYVEQNRGLFDFLQEGERVCGEWLALAHGTIYDSQSPAFAPFVAFDLIRGKQRVVRDEFAERIASVLPTASVLYDGPNGFSVDAAMMEIGCGRHANVDEPEGAVWRVEREGRVDFLAKYVRPQKIDGKYLPNISGAEAIWHWPATAA